MNKTLSKIQKELGRFLDCQFEQKDVLGIAESPETYPYMYLMIDADGAVLISVDIDFDNTPLLTQTVLSVSQLSSLCILVDPFYVSKTEHKAYFGDSAYTKHQSESEEIKEFQKTDKKPTHLH